MRSTRRVAGALLLRRRGRVALVPRRPPRRRDRCTSASSTASTLDADERDPWLDRTVAVGADIVRIDIGWPAPGHADPAGGLRRPRPADPQYDFTRADASIVAARQRAACRCSRASRARRRGPTRRGRPASVPPGTWKPSPQALEEYGAALARRYSGFFPDPPRPGQMLPRVKAFQVWNEPNLASYLNPQWTRLARDLAADLPRACSTASTAA